MENVDATALLVVGHGTQSDRGRAEFHELLARIAPKFPDKHVHGCFLEMAEPNISTALGRIAEMGFREVVVAPMLLFAAGHAKIDIPDAARRAAERWNLRVRFAAPLGTHPKLIELSVRRFQQAIDPLECDPREVAWILVGRGSRDESATAHFREFLAQRQQLTATATAHTAFLAMAQPRLDAVLETVRSTPHKVVVVQPHLLFDGELLQQVERTVNTQDQADPRQHWLRAEHLGPHQLVADTVIDRYHQAIAVSRVGCDAR